MNNKITKGIGLAAMVAVMAGCNEINFKGLMNVLEPITFTQSDKALVTVAPGQFQTKASLGQSGKKKIIKLEIANANPATKVELAFDKNINIGETFTLTAAQLGQAFDVAGTMATKVEKSPEYSGSESCTYQYPQTVCRSGRSAADEAVTAALTSEVSKLDAVIPQRTAPDASNPVPVDTEKNFNAPMPPPYTPVCHTVWMTRPGSMYVRYYVETTLRDIKADFVQAGKNLGTYTGSSTESQRVYTYQGQCF